MSGAQQPPDGGPDPQQPYAYAGPYPPYPPYAYGYPPFVVRKTNWLSVAALVCALAGFGTCFAAPVGLGLGIVALQQIKRTGEEGRGMALAGAWIGGVLTALMVLALVALLVLFVVGAATGFGDPTCTDGFGNSISCD